MTLVSGPIFCGDVKWGTWRGEGEGEGEGEGAPLSNRNHSSSASYTCGMCGEEEKSGGRIGLEAPNSSWMASPPLRRSNQESPVNAP